MGTDWNYADVWEALADRIPDAPALIHGERVVSWRQLDARADGVARFLLDRGVTQQDKLALYLYNAPEYLEASLAALKIGLVPVNTNYRYRQDELLYLWDNADAVAVVFHGALAPTIEEIRGQLPSVRAWLWVDDDSGTCPEWAVPYEEVASKIRGRAVAPWGRAGADLVMIYTGGTTGLPKGVMWRQDDLFRAFDTAGLVACGSAQGIAARAGESVQRPVGLPACPLMHGTGFLFAIATLSQGGAVVTLEARSFDAEELLDTIVRVRVTGIAIVGDAFCRPIVDALDAAPGRWDLSSLAMVASAGVMWSAEVKERLLAHAAGTVLADLLGSTEAHGMGRSVSHRGHEAKTARFTLGENAFVIDDDGRPVEPGSGVVGRIAVKGPVPVGYYKDPEKTARTFIEIDGVRCSVPGDHATVEADGTITLLGRGSVCINTGGEKVFPEEVEEALKTHAAVRDATVVGVPDERFGQAIAAAVELRAGASVEPGELVDHVEGRLAGYKKPRHVLFVDSVGRAPNGKADYAGVQRIAAEWLAKQSR